MVVSLQRYNGEHSAAALLLHVRNVVEKSLGTSRKSSRSKSGGGSTSSPGAATAESMHSDNDDGEFVYDSVDDLEDGYEEEDGEGGEEQDSTAGDNPNLDNVDNSERNFNGQEAAADRGSDEEGGAEGEGGDQRAAPGHEDRGGGGRWAQMDVIMVDELDHAAFVERYVNTATPVILRQRSQARNQAKGAGSGSSSSGGGGMVGVEWLAKHCPDGPVHVFSRDPTSTDWAGWSKSIYCDRRESARGH